MEKFEMEFSSAAVPLKDPQMEELLIEEAGPLMFESVYMLM